MAVATGIETDRAEIRRLVEAYALAMDRSDMEAFRRLFVPDGELVVYGPDHEKPLGTFRGHGPDGVELIARLLGELYSATLHHITTHQVTIDGDAAAGATYCLAYHVVADDEGGLLETLGVRYDEQFIRTPDGWRIRIREATRLWAQRTATPFEPLLIDRAVARSARSSHPRQR